MENHRGTNIGSTNGDITTFLYGQKVDHSKTAAESVFLHSKVKVLGFSL